MDQAFFLSEACRISPGFRHPAFLPTNEASLENQVPGHHSSKCLFSVHEQEIPGWSRCGKGRLLSPGCRAGEWAGSGRCLARWDPPQRSLPSSEGVQGRHLHPCLPKPTGLGFPPAQAVIQVLGESLGPARRLRTDRARRKMPWLRFLGTASCEISLHTLQACFLSETLRAGLSLL